MSSPVAAFIALGSNLGDREKHLRFALNELGTAEGVEVQSASHIYETDPVGPPPQGPYFNAVAQVLTTLTPLALLAFLLEIEERAGRRRGNTRNEARVLDLDLLLYGEEQIDEPGLVLPHPRLHERAFVLEPLAELAPTLLHPELGLTVGKLAESVRNPDAVRRTELLLGS